MMETIKVNMNPNPLDVQTIHASQNDGEARQWEFELHNNGELIDTSDVKEQLFFKAYKGGTEQILPENGSTPTTSPFKGDIKYPQGLLSDQEFLYRESPTEEDGLAKITDIKGNTLNWNQLVQNGNFADKSNWIEANATFTVNNNIATMVASATYGNIEQILSVKANHMYFATCDIKLTTVTNFNLIQFRPYVGVSIPCVSTTEWQTLSGLFIPTTDATVYYPRITDARASGWDAIQIRNCMVIDLTQMGLDISSPSDFTSLFSLPYYAYNQGTLLSFNGNGIKTVGKNLFKPKATFTDNGITFTNDNGVITINGTATANAYFTTDVNLRNGSYFISAFNDEINTGVHVAIRNESGAYPLDITMSPKNRTVSLNNDINKFIIYVRVGTSLNNFVMKPMISFESPEYFEPYTSSTLSLPISTYFPTGMKSAGNVYDELTESKAITRFVKFTVTGTESIYGWGQNYDTHYGGTLVLPSSISGKVKGGANTNGIASMGYTVQYVNNDMTIYVSADGKRIGIINDAFTSREQWFEGITGLEVVIELTTPTETSFTTASLVTENAEIPLSNEDGVLIGKCTEQLSSESGFFDAKIKLTDSDGDVYSNKIQLHIERSPQ